MDVRAERGAGEEITRDYKDSHVTWRGVWGAGSISKRGFALGATSLQQNKTLSTQFQDMCIKLDTGQS